MFLGRIDVFVAENIGYKIDIAGFLIKSRAVGAAEFVRSDFLVRSHLAGIFFDHVFYGLYTHTFSLSGEKERIFMTWERESGFSCCIHICLKCIFHFIPEIYDHFISALACDFNPVIFKINILQIQPDTFRYTDSRTQKKCQDCQIPVFCLFIIYFALSGKIIAAMFDIVKQLSHLIRVKAYNCFFM